MPVKDGGVAFPWGYPGVGGGSGMFLRDYFAGQALEGFISNGLYGLNLERAAAESYRAADAMLVERDKPEEA